ncbi:MAG: ATP-grasp domain-containing protein [Treponema sp.]|nr:ATP-grasp domain-containing protein [Treponema sp.]
MKETIIILGAGVMQGPAIQIAKELGLYTIALDGSSSAPNIAMADKFEQIDLKDKDAIETFARCVQRSTNRLGIMTAGTDFSASVAWTAEKLGLPGIPYEAALNASDKSRMRECFKNAALPSPEFFTITSKDQFESQFESKIDNLPLPFPLVIKPVDNMGSRGCRRVDCIKEFHEAAKSAIGFSRTGRIIVERFMDGDEFSVDAIVYKGEITICGLADRHIFFPPYFIEMGHTMPAKIEPEKQTEILETFRRGVHALGLAGKDCVGAAKGDIKLTSKGAMIGEIAARLSGGYMSGWTYPYASGVFPIKSAILAAMGREPIGLIPSRDWTCAERAFISIPGTVKQISNNLSSDFVNDFFLRIKEGDKVLFPENNVTKCGNVIASAQDRETAINAAEAAARSVFIRLDPADNKTGEFLGLFHTEAQGYGEYGQKANVFPPNAFQLTEELLEELAQIPDTKGLSSQASTMAIIPFPAFTASKLTDYMGRTVWETLEVIRFLTDLTLPISDENAENIIRLGRSFWAALIRGSYQGAVYYIDKLRRNNEKTTTQINYSYMPFTPQFAAR